MDRYVLVAHLKPGSRERAQQLLAEHPMHEGVATFDREAVFLSDTEVVFFLEGPDADKSIKAIFDDPSVTEISHWLPLFDGPLHRAPEAYFWERGEGQDGTLPNLEVALLQASIIEESSGAGRS